MAHIWIYYGDNYNNAFETEIDYFEYKSNYYTGDIANSGSPDHAFLYELIRLSVLSFAQFEAEWRSVPPERMRSSCGICRYLILQ